MTAPAPTTLTVTIRRRPGPIAYIARMIAPFTPHPALLRALIVRGWAITLD